MALLYSAGVSWQNVAYFCILWCIDSGVWLGPTRPLSEFWIHHCLGTPRWSLWSLREITYRSCKLDGGRDLCSTFSKYRVIYLKNYQSSACTQTYIRRFHETALCRAGDTYNSFKNYFQFKFQLLCQTIPFPNMLRFPVTTLSQCLN